MNNIAKKWLEALRGGDYLQGKGCLRDNDHFCCLGVLADIIDKEKWVKWEDKFTWEDDSLSLRSDTYELAGFDGDFAATLMNMNDIGRSFEEIADVIEGHLNADKI